MKKKVSKKVMYICSTCSRTTSILYSAHGKSQCEDCYQNEWKKRITT